jgi:hypothetical protein
MPHDPPLSLFSMHSKKPLKWESEQGGQVYTMLSPLATSRWSESQRPNPETNFVSPCAASSSSSFPALQICLQLQSQAWLHFLSSLLFPSLCNISFFFQISHLQIKLGSKS